MAAFASRFSGNVRGVVNFVSQAPKYGGANDEFHGNASVFYTSPTNGGGGNVLLTYGTKSYGLLLNMNVRRISTLKPEVQNRLLPIGAEINGVRIVNNDTLVPMFPHVAGYGLVGVRSALKFSEKSEILVDFENIFDKSYRGISWGVDGAGRGVTLRYRYEF